MNPSSPLLGTVSIGNVLSPPILELYQFCSSESVQLDGADTLKLEFVALSPYGTMIYYYQQEHIIASESYTHSGILLKSLVS